MSPTEVKSGTPGSTPAPALAPQAPPGYKFMKVRKPDGTIVTVKKKLSPEELEKLKAQAETPKTEPVGTKTASEYKIITVRMPDGTLAKVKRPVQSASVTTKPVATAPTDSATTATAAKSDAAPEREKQTNPEAAAPEPTSEDKALLREQKLNNKRQRRARFGTALLFGLVGAAETALPDLVDGDEIISDTDLSDDEFDDDHHHEADEHEVDEKGDSSAALAPAVAAGATAVAAGIVVGAMAGQQPAQPVNQPNQVRESPQANGNNKNGYKVTVKDLKDLDDKAAQQQELEKPLERRWAAFSFYFLASLSILLPVLFLVLAGFIIGMEDKSSDSSWGQMMDPIKIAVTVWPIVFAAVAAQGFKTWAAYKVERGIKLMELEQLVGSNSFGSVMKQPFVLRRLDLLTLGIFTIWALSPIGSQALLRIYTLERGLASDQVAVKYVPIMGHNMLLSPGAAEEFGKPNVLAELWQSVSVYYMGALMPSGIKFGASMGSLSQDIYNHPLPMTLLNYRGESPVALYGVPVALPNPEVQVNPEDDKDKKKKEASADAQAPFENITFPVTSSFFNFSCNPWQTTTYGILSQANTSISISETLAIEFLGPANSSSIDRMRFATLLDGSVLNETSIHNTITPDPGWKYGLIECGFEQVFFNSTVNCHLDVKTGSYAFDCGMSGVKFLPPDQVRPEWHTTLADFSEEFIKGANPFPVLYPYTPTERYIFSNQQVDGYPVTLEPLKFTPEGFAYSFGLLFNTFVTIAHCPQCITTSNVDAVQPGSGFPEEAIALYVPPATPDSKALRFYSLPGLFFALDWRWVAVFLTCVIVLLLVGIASVVLESVLIAPDVLGYASTLARNSRYLHLPKRATKSMSGPERARVIGHVKVMIQDVKPDNDVGKIALGLKHNRAERLKHGRVYR